MSVLTEIQSKDKSSSLRVMKALFIWTIIGALFIAGVIWVIRINNEPVGPDRSGYGAFQGRVS